MRVLQINTKNKVANAKNVFIPIANSLVQKAQEVSIVTRECKESLWTILEVRIKNNNCTTLKQSLYIKHDWKTILSLKFNTY